MRIKTLICLLLLLAPVSQSFGGDDLEQRLKTLEDASKTQSKTIEEQQRVIDEMKKGSDNGNLKPTGVTGLFGGSSLGNPNISLIVDTFFYSSNLNNVELESRGIPGFTSVGIERKNGFNLGAAELFIYAPVDPYLNLYATLPVTEAGAEVEEAYFITTALPKGLQIKGGKFKSGFGRINAQHPHAWDFADAPLVCRAFIGEEGMTEKGVQLTYLPSLPFYTQLGIEALQGENELLFGPDAKSGAHAFSTFAKASFDTGEYSTILLGPSVVTGKAKNPSIADGTEFEGDTTLYDFEFTYKWKPSKDRSFTLQSEYLLRSQDGDLTDTALSTTEPLKRTQDGAYIQGAYQMGRWRAGARFGRLGLFKDEYALGGEDQTFGEQPWKATGSLELNPTEFSRIRVQYNQDRSARDDRTNHEVFLQFTLGIGAHAAHNF